MYYPVAKRSTNLIKLLGNVRRRWFPCDREDRSNRSTTVAATLAIGGRKGSSCCCCCCCCCSSSSSSSSSSSRIVHTLFLNLFLASLLLISNFTAYVLPGVLLYFSVFEAFVKFVVNSVKFL